MANTYTQIYIQLIFAVKYRTGLILQSFKDELYKYISGIFRNQGQKMLAINGMPDHLHIFFGMEPDLRLSDFVRDVKSDSSLFINEKKFLRYKFHWQKGYGAFSYSQSQKDSVIKYINNQEQHHKKKSFRDEYLDFLNRFKIEFNEKYLFDFFDWYRFRSPTGRGRLYGAVAHGRGFILPVSNSYGVNFKGDSKNFLINRL